MSDYDMSIHTNPDARAWAKFFMETYEKSEDKAAFIAEDNMIGWFANAMMAMRDHMRPDMAPVVMPDGSAFCVGTVAPQTFKPSANPALRDTRNPNVLNQRRGPLSRPHHGEGAK